MYRDPEYNKLLGNPELTPTHFADAKPGKQTIVINTVHFGYQQMIMEKDVPVKARDGVTLYVNIFRPDAEGKYPVIMSADAYGKDALPVFDSLLPKWPTIGKLPTSEYTNDESPDPGYWVPQGYVVIKLAVRGSSNSEGDLKEWTDQEGRDYADVVEWAAAQPFCNGNVGTNGVSYLAVTQWFLAAERPPHLKAIVPWEGLNDLYREIAFHGGIPNTGFHRMWVSGLFRRWPQSRVDDLNAAQKEHPLYDDFWEERRAKLENIDVPMLVCGSWSTIGLHQRGSLGGYMDSKSQEKWLYIHGRKEWETYYLRECLEMQKAFFDHYLKGIDNDWEETAPVKLEVRDKAYIGEFRTEENWPIPRTQYTPLYLNGADMTLGKELPAEEKELSYNAEAGEGDDHELKFRITFDEDTELTGYEKLRLYVATKDTDDMDLFVGVKKYDRRGKEVYFPDFNHIETGCVTYGWLRASHRELDEEKSTEYRPVHTHRIEQKLEKGEIVPVDIELWASGTLFRKGETLELILKGSEIISDESCDDGLKRRHAHDETLNVGRHYVYTGGKYDSYLLVPVIPAKQ